MSLRIPDALLRRITHHAERAFPRECCGLLVGRVDGCTAHVERVIEADNVSSGDRTRTYEIEPQVAFDTFRHARHAGGAVVGFYHSHTDGGSKPSAHDLRTAWPDKSYLIVGIRGGAVTAVASWRLPHGSAAFAEEAVN